jgi:hypothetical protein
MDKTFGEKKYKYIHKNKFNKKKQKYSNHHSKASLNKPVRNYIKSYINHNFNNIENLENFILPLKMVNTNNWWDCEPPKPKVFTTHK